jgi:hypothetical protein
MMHLFLENFEDLKYCMILLGMDFFISNFCFPVASLAFTVDLYELAEEYSK